MSDWNSDMSKAPRDGTEILLFCPGINCWQRKLRGEVVIGVWDGAAWYSDSCSSMEGYESTGDYVVHDPVFPTHWAYLPSPPTE